MQLWWWLASQNHVCGGGNPLDWSVMVKSAAKRLAASSVWLWKLACVHQPRLWHQRDRVGDRKGGGGCSLLGHWGIGDGRGTGWQVGGGGGSLGGWVSLLVSTGCYEMSVPSSTTLCHKVSQLDWHISSVFMSIQILLQSFTYKWCILFHWNNSVLSRNDIYSGVLIFLM